MVGWTQTIFERGCILSWLIRTCFFDLLGSGVCEIIARGADHVVLGLFCPRTPSFNVDGMNLVFLALRKKRPTM